jgi:3-hydroxyisobutyrate dehydrogenase-like beta-hydroxyacid dehydrogenase
LCSSAVQPGYHRSNVVFTMLANDEAVAGMAFGDDGIIASLRPGAVHVSSSTISIELSEQLTALTSARGKSSSPHRYSDAPMLQRRASCSSSQRVTLTR